MVSRGTLLLLILFYLSGYGAHAAFPEGSQECRGSALGEEAEGLWQTNDRPRPVRKRFNGHAVICWRSLVGKIT